LGLGNGRNAFVLSQWAPSTWEARKPQGLLTFPLPAHRSPAPIIAAVETIWVTEFTEPVRQEILQHLALILADRRFVSSERNGGFLRCVVEKSLAGQAHEIKEIVIAMEVYGRTSDYDPKSDSIVRVEATRLRQKLRSYYENEGRTATIRFHLPSGGYVPRFERVPSADGDVVLPFRPAASRPRRLIAATVAAGLAVLPIALALPLAGGLHPAREAAPDALEAWREGMALLHQDPHTGHTEWGPPKPLLRAIERLEYAVARSPRFAPAWATTAEAYDYAAGFVTPDPAQASARAEAAARMAIRLDDRLAAGHHMLALQLKSVKWDFGEAEASFRRALALDPMNAYAVVEFADLLWETGRVSEAEAQVRRARSLQPGLAVLAFKDAEIQLALGRPGAAIAAASSALELQRDYLRARVVIGSAYEERGDFESARAEYRRVLDADPNERRALPAYGFLLGRLGEVAAAREVARKLERMNATVRNCAFQVAVVYAGLKEDDLALEWLERAWRTRQAHFPFAAAERRFRRLHRNARFGELLGRVGLDPLPQ
jgi:tetratricopeptide (TPR) repeat protein